MSAPSASLWRRLDAPNLVQETREAFPTMLPEWAEKLVAAFGEQGLERGLRGLDGLEFAHLLNRFVVFPKGSRPRTPTFVANA
jgi:hypothetical protein